MNKKKSWLSSKPNEAETQKEWIDEVLDVLGHYIATEVSRRVGDKRILNPDYAFLQDFSQKQNASKSEDFDVIDSSYAIGDAKKWNLNLDKSGEKGNPAFQIYDYVERLRANWGILTNGRKWRLYSYEDCGVDIFYEVDLVEILENNGEGEFEAFKYFYLFFRQESFLPKKRGFVDRILEGSITYAESLEDDLEEKVYSALEIAVNGFFETNNLKKTEENISLVHHASLILLYRLLFILNAESRGLLPVEDESYKQAFGLVMLKKLLLENPDVHIFNETTVAWDGRISRLFEGINKGYDLHESEIPAYNGGLFASENNEANQFLSEKQLYGNYLKEILDLLVTNIDEEKNEKVLVDYKDLNIRHLGSIYEGLLEHEFKVASERMVLNNGEWSKLSEVNKQWADFSSDIRADEGDLYLTNESGERKATGSYYTPEYIVKYIVENTIGPKVEEKIKEAKDNGGDILSKVLELQVCDPAMGSGHFLTEATQFIAKKIVENGDLGGKNIAEKNEITWAKRQVVKNCIYGVDINPLATELAKLSLWIETMSRGKPLSFLDHHLRVGNSLIGADVFDLNSHPEDGGGEDEEEGGQLTIQQTLERIDDVDYVKEGMKKILAMYQKILDKSSETLEDVHEKEQIFHQLRDYDFRKRFDVLADVYTSYYFDNKFSETEYNELLEAFISDDEEEWRKIEDEEWVKKASDSIRNSRGDNLSDEKEFFHWKIEFPEVFFDLETGEEKKRPGFDSVIGNPPYVSTSTIEGHSQYFKTQYESAKGKYDLYSLFVEKGENIRSINGKFSYILPNKFLKTAYGSPTRKILQTKVEKIIDFRSNQIFDAATTYTCIIILSDSEEVNYISVGTEKGLAAFKNRQIKSYGRKDYCLELDKSNLDSNPWIFNTEKVQNVKKKISEKPRLGDSNIIQAYDGLRTNADSALLFEIVGLEEDYYKVTSSMIEEDIRLEKEILKPCLKGSEVSSYQISDPTNVVFYPYRSGEPLAPEEIKDKYPNTWNYLNRTLVKDKLESRKGSFGYFYELTDPRTEDKFEELKIIVQTLSKRTKCALDSNSYYFVGGGTAGAKGIRSEDVELLQGINCLINSSLCSFYLINEGSEFNNNYYAFSTGAIQDFGVDRNVTQISNYSSQLQELAEDLADINLQLEDYLGNYDYDKSIEQLYEPIKKVSETPIQETTKEKKNLKVEAVEFDEHNDNLVMKVSVKYKPENPETFDDLDRWGYTETNMIPAMKFTNLSKIQKTLIKEFIPLAVDKASGFANFRKKATKTKSIIDRLEELTLPKLEEVKTGLKKYAENKKKAEELKADMRKIKNEIDAVVFDLYDLTEEEVETVLDSLETPEDEKKSIIETFKSI